MGFLLTRPVGACLWLALRINFSCYIRGIKVLKDLWHPKIDGSFISGSGS